MQTSPLVRRRRILPPLILVLAAGAFAQVKLPPPDADGWMKLFRGDNVGDFFEIYPGANWQEHLAFPAKKAFDHKGDTITSLGNPGGHVVFKQVFSHYRIQYEIMFPGTMGNAGMLLHARENEEFLDGNHQFPRSVECQGDYNQGLGELWTISKIWVTVRAKGDAANHVYDSTAAEVLHGSNVFNSNRRCHMNPDKAVKQSGVWNKVEAVVNGADSISHYVNGVRVIRYTKIYIDETPRRPLDSGKLAWQSEGSGVWYRNIRLKLLPGDPLYPTVQAGRPDGQSLGPAPARKTLLFRDGVLGFFPADREDGAGADARGRELPRILGETPKAP